MYYEWMLLDTHDALTDAYKHRRTVGEMRCFLQTLCPRPVVTAGGNGVEAFCRKPDEGGRLASANPGSQLTMCGIAGVLGTSLPDIEPRLEAMASTLRHRGPDAGGSG